MGTSRTRLSGLKPALLAAGVYGGWALYVNSAYGPWHAGGAFLAQALASFATTLLLTRLIEFLYERIPNPILKAVLTPTGAIGLIGIALVAIHTLSQTPDIATTIAPSLVIGFAYCLYCTVKLLRSEHQEA